MEGEEQKEPEEEGAGEGLAEHDCRGQVDTALQKHSSVLDATESCP